MNKFKLVVNGDYFCVIKMGRCPLYAIEHKNKAADMIDGLKEDFPDCCFEQGDAKDKAEIAKRIYLRDKMNGR